MGTGAGFGLRVDARLGTHLKEGGGVLVGDERDQMKEGAWLAEYQTRGARARCGDRVGWGISATTFSPRTEGRDWASALLERRDQLGRNPT